MFIFFKTLIVLLRRPPPQQNRRLIVFATTSISHLLEQLQLAQAFNVTVHVSQLQSTDEYKVVLQQVNTMNKHFKNKIILFHNIFLI
jgi:hypothetical protein